MAEQRPGLVDPALADQPADARARHHELLVAHRVDLLDPEAVLLAQGAQHREVAGPVAAEQEVGADPHLGDAQPVDQHRASRSVSGDHCDSSGVKRTTAAPVHAGPVERAQLLRQWSSAAAAPCRAAPPAADADRRSARRRCAPRSAAPRRMRSMIFWWPRCRPSKLPSASTGLIQRGGRGSSGIVDDVHHALRPGPPSGRRDVDLEHQAVVGQRHARRQVAPTSRRAAGRGRCG